MANARKELSDFIETTADKVYFIENEERPYQPKYRELFRSVNIPGREIMISSATHNINFQKRIDGEPLVYTDPTSGRRVFGKKELYTAGTKIPDRFTNGLDVRRPSDELKNYIRDWTQAAINRYHLDLETFAFDHFNKGGLTAGDPIFDGTNDVQEDKNGGLLYDGSPLFNLAASPRTLLKKPPHLSTNAFNNGLGSTGQNLTSENFETAYQKLTMDNAYNDAGEKTMRLPTHLVVPPSLRSDAFQILKTSVGLPGDVNNGANPNFEIVDMALSPFLDDADAWFLYAADGSWEIFDQEQPRFKSWINNDTDCYHLRMEVAYGSLIKAWQNVVGANFATS